MLAQKSIISFMDLGLVDYKKAWDFQEQLFQQSISLKVENRNYSEEEQTVVDNYLLFCEHPHVYTLGKSGMIENLLLNNTTLKDKGIQFYKNNRGGDITYHGPGQIVGYPILDLDQYFTDIGRYLRCLEEIIIRTLKYYDLVAGRIKGVTGVWLDSEHPDRARKICAMGVRASRWVTMHGFAFNVNTNLEYFNYIVPCGIQDKGVTSIAQELNRKIDIEETKNILKSNFERVFDSKMITKQTFEKRH